MRGTRGVRRRGSEGNKGGVRRKGSEGNKGSEEKGE